MINTGVYYAEDELPQGQEPIMTKNNKKFEAYITVITHPQKTPRLGLATGKSGVGKTTAINKYVEDKIQGDIRGLPTIAKFKVPTTATALSVAKELCYALGETPLSSGNKNDVAKAAAEFIKNNGIRLIFVDEGDRLNKESFDTIRAMFDQTGCIFVIVGLPHILQVINAHEQFASRIGPRMNFKKPDLNEVLDTILPQLKILNWHYDPKNLRDRELGEKAWKMTRSFRRLYDLLETAGVLADIHGKTRIDKDFLKSAFDLHASDHDKRELKKTSSESPPERPEDSPLEDESEQRKDSKNDDNEDED